MSQPTELSYSSLPSVLPFYARAATRLSDRWTRTETIPPIEARVTGVTAQPLHVARYREVCAFPSAKTLPVTYPHVLAFPLHMAVLTHEHFPLRLLGLVHVRNEITQYRPIGVEETLNLRVSVAGHRDVRTGIEFDLVTELNDGDDEVVWQEVGVMLSRRRRGGKSSQRNREPGMPLTGYEQQALWFVEADIGRRYARVAGDYNPIHLSALSARLFGFRRAIATGMWLKARVASELTPQVAPSAYSLQVSFRKPVFLPSPATFRYSLNGEGADFSLTDPAGEFSHLQGLLRYN